MCPISTVQEKALNFISARTLWVVGGGKQTTGEGGGVKMHHFLIKFSPSIYGAQWFEIISEGAFLSIKFFIIIVILSLVVGCQVCFFWNAI